MEFEVWFYKALIGIFGMFIWYFIKQWFKKLTDKIDELICSINKVVLKNEEQNGDIRLLNEKVGAHEVRLNYHSQSIKELERKVK